MTSLSSSSSSSGSSNQSVYSCSSQNVHKRPRTIKDKPSKIKIMSVLWTSNIQDTAQNCVWMNGSDIDELCKPHLSRPTHSFSPIAHAQRFSGKERPFSNSQRKGTVASENTEASQPAYVRIANRVYAAVERHGISSGIILMNRIQYMECWKAMSRLHVTDVVVVEEFKQEQDKASELETALIEVSQYNPGTSLELDEDEEEGAADSKTLSIPAIARVEQLRKQFQENNMLDFFAEGQLVVQLDGARPFKGKFLSTNHPSISPLNKKNFFSRLTEKTRLDFQVATGSDIVLVDREFSAREIDCFYFTINPIKKWTFPKALEGWKGGKNPLPLTLFPEEIKKFIYSNSKEKYLLPGEKIIYNHNNEWNIEIIFAHASLKQSRLLQFTPPPPPPPPPPPSPSSTSDFSWDFTAPVHSIGFNEILQPLPPPQDYQALYEFDLESKIDFAESKDIIFVSGPFDYLKEADFEIIDFQNIQGLPLKIQPCVLEKDLVEEIQKMNLQLALGQKIILEFSTIRCLLELKGDFEKDKLYRIDEETKLRFSVKQALPLTLGDHSKSFAIKNLKVAVSLEGRVRSFLLNSSAADLLFEEERLEKMLFEKLPESGIFMGQKLYMPLENDKRLVFHVTDMVFDPADKKQENFIPLGKYTKDTVVSFSTEPHGGISLLKAKEETAYKTPDEMMKSLELGGLSDQFKTIIRDIVLAKDPSMREEMDALGIKPVKGLLLYGPPGTGKTTLARNLGKVLGCEGERLQMISGAEIWDKWLGNSEQNIRNLFKPAREALAELKEKSPLYVVVIDEIDAMLAPRDSDESKARMSVVNQFLGELDGLKELNNIFVVGLTNNKHRLDPAVLRPGRIEVHIEIGLPNKKGRLEIFEIHTKKLKENGRLAKDVDLEKLAEETDGWVGADIEGLIRKASNYPRERLYSLPEKQRKGHPQGQITKQDFDDAFKEIEKANGKEKNETWRHMFL